jgi:hypothetical protein
MKPLLFLLVSGMAFASPPDAFWRALHLTETSGRLGPIKGDKGKALGPFQIHRKYWEDTKQPGKYEDVADYDYAKQVVTAYLKKYARKAWDDGDIQTLARVHNGGPNGHRKESTLGYAKKVMRNLP